MLKHFAHFLNLHFNTFKNLTLPDDMLIGRNWLSILFFSHWRLHLSWAKVLASVNCFSASFLASKVYIWLDLWLFWFSKLHAFFKIDNLKARSEIKQLNDRYLNEFYFNSFIYWSNKYWKLRMRYLLRNVAKEKLKNAHPPHMENSLNRIVLCMHHRVNRLYYGKVAT